MIRRLLARMAFKVGLYKYAVFFDTKIINKKHQRYMKKYGLETLIQADIALKSVGSFFFLDFGTLLGAYRENNFISHDKDIDVGILAEKIPPNMKELLGKYGFVPVRQYLIKETNCIVVDTYAYKGAFIDFFVYFKKEEDIYCYFAKAHEYLPPDEANATNGFPAGIRWGKNDGFSTIDFLGHEFFVPGNVSNWLIDVYGKSYMTPKKNWFFADYISEEQLNVKCIDERLYRNNY